MGDERHIVLGRSAAGRNTIEFWGLAPGVGVLRRDWAFGSGVAVCHPGFAIELLLEGEGQVASEGVVFDVSPGVYLTHPMQVLVVKNRRSERTRSIAVWIDEHALEKFAPPVPGSGPLRAKSFHCDDVAVRRALSSLVATVGPVDWDRQDQLDALIGALHGGGWIGRGSRKSVPGGVGLAMDHLHESFDDTVTRQSLATLAGVDKHTLARRFREFTGLTPQRYLLLLRVTRVRQLVDRGVSIADAAAQSGFHDQAHLTRHFKRVLGVTPARYRRLLGIRGSRGQGAR